MMCHLGVAWGSGLSTRRQATVAAGGAKHLGEGAAGSFSVFSFPVLASIRARNVHGN